MPWVLAYLLIAILIPIAYKIAFEEGITWKSRLTRWFFLALPVFLYMLLTGYFTTNYQHIKDCDADGGLKVFIQPEKSDSLQLLSRGESSAQSILYHHYPTLKFVEAQGDSRESRRNPAAFFSYSVKSTNNSKKANDWTFSKKPLASPSSDLYVLSRSVDRDKNRTKYQWKLTKNNQIYAKFTDFRHSWSSGIRYSDAAGGSSWYCRERSIDSSEFDDPEKNMIKLILE